MGQNSSKKKKPFGKVAEVSFSTLNPNFVYFRDGSGKLCSAAYALWTGKEMTERLQSLLQPEILPGDFPMELRLYSIGAAMGWYASL